MLDTLIFDPAACRFPKPAFPILPTGLTGIRWRQQTTADPEILHFTRGRYALREAYRLSGIGPGNILLAPAYHCRTMLDPAIELGGNVLLYPLTPTLAPRLDAIQQLAQESPAPIRALLATHFFGFAQDLAELAEWCRREQIALVEDCSHALYCLGHHPASIGQTGDYVVSSPYKFLPSPDGGLLKIRAPEHGTTIQPTLPRWKDEIKALLHLARSARESPFTPPTGITADAPAIAPEEHGHTTRQWTRTSHDYRESEQRRAALRTTRFLWRHSDLNFCTQQRRANYQTLASALTGIPCCRPLYPELDERTTPYMLPLLIDHPQPHFTRLKQQGIPIWRWDSMVISDCPTATHYRTHLLHLPCHQGITPAQQSWLIRILQQVLSSPCPQTP